MISNTIFTNVPSIVFAFFFLRDVQIGSRAQPALVGTGGCFHGDKAAGRWAIPPLPCTSSRHDAKLIYYGSIALFWALAAFPVFFILYTVGRTPWTRISPSQSRYLHTGQHKHRINAHTNIHALSGIRTHDPSVQASEDSSCLRLRGPCDRRLTNYTQR
jgi:hypothetical protein